MKTLIRGYRYSDLLWMGCATFWVKKEHIIKNFLKRGQIFLILNKFGENLPMFRDMILGYICRKWDTCLGVSCKKGMY